MYVVVMTYLLDRSVVDLSIYLRYYSAACIYFSFRWGPFVHSLEIVQWDATRRDHPGYTGRVSGSGPIKFAITAFITRLGVQSKDLMFSISKNPQASMAEVLAKTEKYINGEEALHLKQRSSSTQKEKSRGEKKRERSPKR